MTVVARVNQWSVITMFVLSIPVTYYLTRDEAYEVVSSLQTLEMEQNIADKGIKLESPCPEPIECEVCEHCELCEPCADCVASTEAPQLDGSTNITTDGQTDAIQTMWRYEFLDLMDVKSDYQECLDPNNDVTKPLLSEHKSKDYNATILPWVAELCPDVVEHFTIFPSFDTIPEPEKGKDPPAPIQNTDYAMRSTCALYVTHELAKQVKAPVYMHAGSHLGAVLHGGPIPWDDDVDVFLGLEHSDAFLEACKNFKMPEGAKLNCYRDWDAMKLSITDELSVQSHRDWTSPFIDIFAFIQKDGVIREVNTNGNWREQNYKTDEYFPPKMYYYAGLVLPAPNDRIPKNRYSGAKCFLSNWNHRWELQIPKHKQLDCCMLAKEFPFAHYLKSPTEPEVTYQLIKVDGVTKLVTSTNATSGEVTVYKSPTESKVFAGIGDWEK